MDSNLNPVELVARGRRELICKNFPEAVEKFQQACELISKEHGDLADELAEPNYYYGCALLELARMESGVIGNALQGVPSSDDDEEEDADLIEKDDMTEEQKEEIAEQVIDALIEPRDEANEDVVEESKEATEDIEEEAKETEETKDEAPEENEKVDDEDGSEDDDEEEEAADEEKEDLAETKEGDDESTSSDEVDNLQLAWEVIEVAKQIFTKNSSLKSQTRVTDCLERLAEISREKEQFEQAMEDLEECLRLRKELPIESEVEKIRLIAETEYQMAATSYVAGWLDKAATLYRSSHHSLSELVKSQREELEKMIAEGDESKNDVAEQLRLQVEELEGIVKDIGARCGEVDEDRLEATIDKSSTTLARNGLQADQKADDISHLVRKKRPVAETTTNTTPEKENKPVLATDEENGEKGPESKKTKLTANGDSSEEVPVA